MNDLFSNVFDDEDEIVEEVNVPVEPAYENIPSGDKTTGFKIIKIEIENNKAVKCFNVVLNGKNLEIAGDTATGKTTATSALWEILEKQSDSLTHGEKKGLIKVQLRNNSKVLNMKRTLREKSSDITITDESGEKVSIKDFKDLLSDLSVNPHKILDMKPKERTEALLKAADMGDFDLTNTENHIAILTETRLEKQRELKMFPEVPEPEKIEPVVISTLLDELQVVETNNNKITQNQRIVSELTTQVMVFQSELDVALAKVERLKNSIASTETERETEIANFYGMEIVSADPIRERIHNAENINKNAAYHESWVANNTKRENINKLWKDADKAVKEAEKAKKDALDNAKFPLPGLSIEEGNVLFNGILMENLGESEQILVCCALSINTIKEIKVVRIDGAESMSLTDYEAMRKLFNDSGIQVLSTRVARGDTDPNEIVITEGVYEGGK